MQKTPGHKLAFQAETRNQQVALPQSIQELEKPSNSGRFPDFLNPATRSNEHRKCRARQARYATRGERVRLQDTRRPFRSEAFPFACRTVQRTARCVQRACQRSPRPKACCASQGARRLLSLRGFPVCKGFGGREASKRKGPPGEGSWFSKGWRHRGGRAGVWRRSAAQEGTIPGFPGLATSVGARKARFRARTARSGAKRPEPRSGKPGIVPKRRLKPFRGSESPGTRQRSSQDGPSQTAPIRQRPKGAPPTSRERGRFEFGVALRAPFCGPSSRSALRIGRQGPGGEVEPPASGTKGLPLCPTSAAP